MAQAAKGTERPFNADRMAWIEQVQDDHTLGPAAVSLAVAIARHLNRRTGVAFPSQETLASKVGVRSRQIRNVLGQLKEGGHLIVEAGGFQRPDTYKPILADRQSTTAINPATQHRYEPGNRTSSERQSNVVETGSPVPPNLRFEPDIEPVSRTQKALTEEEALAYVEEQLAKFNVDDDPRRVLLACQSHYGEEWPAKLKSWTVGAIGRASEKPRRTAVAFDGPIELRADVSLRQGDGFTIAYLDPCHWREIDRVLMARNKFAAGKLVEAMGEAWLRHRDITVLFASEDDASSP